MRSNNKIAKKFLSLRFWHRNIGLVTALFVIFLVVTGWLLNHTEELQLDSRYLRIPKLLNLYNIKSPEPVSFKAGDQWITQLGERFYLGSEELSGTGDRFIGAVKIDSMIVVAVSGRLSLFTSEGELIENLDGADGVPAGMSAVGITPDNRFGVRAAHGEYTTDLEDPEWLHSESSKVTWAEPMKLPARIEDRLLDIYRGRGLSMERVVMDLHSGRIFGSWGVYVVDGAAGLFLLLALSGLWMWAKRPY